MFQVKRIETNKIYTVLDTCFDDVTHQTHFLIWENKWCWRPADKYELVCDDKSSQPTQEEMIARFLK